MDQFKVNLADGTLDKFAELELPDAVQYAWMNSLRSILYAACSDGRAPPRPPGTNHRLVAMRVDQRTGALSIHGGMSTLPGRAVHMTLDATNRYALVAYNNPPGATIHRISADGSLEKVTEHVQDVDFGHYPHQIRVTPSNKHVVVVSRGTRPNGKKQGTPGALKVASYSEGQLKMHSSIEPNGGINFGARHLDFHQTKPWVYVSLEFENKLQMFGFENDRFTEQPLYSRETLVNPTFVAPLQMAGTVHIHPNGRTVYVVNRANGTVEFQGRHFFSGGDNTMAVFSIDQQTGEPKLIQSEETRGMHARTFSIDPSGRLMVVAHNHDVEVRNTSSIGSHTVYGGLSVFRILEEGKIEFLRKIDSDAVENRQLLWSKLYQIAGGI